MMSVALQNRCFVLLKKGRGVIMVTARGITVAIAMLMLLTTSACTPIGKSELVDNDVSLFTIADDGMTDEVSKEVLVGFEGEITAKDVLNLYIDEIFSKYDEENPFFNSVTVTDNIALVDLTKSGLDFISAGSFMEITSIDGISKSIMYNNPTVEGVAFAVEGGDYNSGHFYFAKTIPVCFREDFGL